jgi:hypothetical protein
VDLDIARRSYSISILNPEKRYWITVERVSLADYLKGKIYHFYDMKVPTKIPGWRRFEDFLQDRFGAEILLGFTGERKPRLADRILSWQYGQDLRCDHLNRKGKKICQIEVDRETWEEFGDVY